MGKKYYEQVKGLLQEDYEARKDVVILLPERIRAIPDGATKKTAGYGASSSHKNIKFDSGGDRSIILTDIMLTKIKFTFNMENKSSIKVK